MNDTVENNNLGSSDIQYKTKGIRLDTIVKLDDVVVSSTRSERKSAMAYSKLNKQEIKEQNLGQDLPYLLNQQPSVVTTSDAEPVLVTPVSAFVVRMQHV